MDRNPVNAALVALLPTLPRSLVWRISRRYIAGVGLEDALDAVAALNRRGILGTIDVLGEDVRRREQVAESVALYHEVLAGIHRRTLNCNVSIKLSEFGLRFDVGLCRRMMAAIVADAAERGTFVRIDMEDSSVTDATLSIFRELRAGTRQVGIVLQSCLHRTEADTRALLEEGIAHVRLCKGIYREPSAIAHQRPAAISRAWCDLLEQLVDGGCEKIGIATHDPALVRHALTVLKTRAVDRERYEFQMLLGVAEKLRDELVAAGHPLRVYVPFGEHWFAYSSRRLRENPAIAGHVASNLLLRR